MTTALLTAAILVALAWADRDATAAEDKNSERIYP